MDSGADSYDKFEISTKQEQVIWSVDLKYNVTYKLYYRNRLAFTNIILIFFFKFTKKNTFM